MWLYTDLLQALKGERLSSVFSPDGTLISASAAPHCRGDWNVKVGKDAGGNWQGICEPLCNDDTNERGLRLLEFATFNDLVLANTFCDHKASRRWTWHSPNGQHHNQFDYILMKMHFQSGVNSARTQSFRGADIGSDHHLLMMTCHLCLQRISKPKHTRLKFDLEMLKDPNE